jgi:hypothetical protein
VESVGGKSDRLELTARQRARIADLSLLLEVVLRTNSLRQASFLVSYVFKLMLLDALGAVHVSFSPLY